MKKLYNFLFSTQFMLILIFVANIIVYAVCAAYLGWWVYGLFAFAGMLLAMALSNTVIETTATRILWFMVTIIMPFFGVTLFYFTRGRNGTKKERKVWQDISNRSEEYLEIDTKCEEELKKVDIETIHCLTIDDGTIPYGIKKGSIDFEFIDLIFSSYS